MIAFNLSPGLRRRMGVIASVCALATGSSACDVEELAFAAPAMTAVSIGEAHSCAVAESGAIYCWGSNDFGQLGTGNPESGRFAVRLVSERQFVAIDAGARHTCALTADGAAYCWGANDTGQLGTGDRDRGATPRLVNTAERFVSLSAGWTHTCALTADGRAFCWGQNTYGELGSNSFDAAVTPTAVVTNVRFTQISAGGRHTCALDLNEFAHCWGANEVAQLGNGQESAPHNTPVPVLASFAFSNVSAGWNHTCGATPQHVAYCWGENVFGETGTSWRSLPGVPAHPYPGQVDNYGEFMFVHVSAGKYYSCGTRDNGKLTCWGKGDYGQLGTGQLTDHVNPQDVVPGPLRAFVLHSDVFAKADAGHGNHTCAIAFDGTVFCWGDGQRGQLGNDERLSQIALPVLEVRSN